jgi:hypothetical protein
MNLREFLRDLWAATGLSDSSYASRAGMYSSPAAAPTPAVGEDGARPGGRSVSPCAAEPTPGASHLHRLRELAQRAEAETYEPGWPYGGSGDWSGNVDAMLGGATGEYCAALRPDAVLVVLDSLERLSGPCEAYDSGRCTEGLSINNCCRACVAYGAIEALISPNPSSRSDSAPRGESARPGSSPTGGDVCEPGRAFHFPS